MLTKKHAFLKHELWKIARRRTSFADLGIQGDGSGRGRQHRHWTAAGVGNLQLPESGRVGGVLVEAGNGPRVADRDGGRAAFSSLSRGGVGRVGG